MTPDGDAYTRGARPQLAAKAALAATIAELATDQFDGGMAA
jgi:hypothetical protein